MFYNMCSIILKQIRHYESRIRYQMLDKVLKVHKLQGALCCCPIILSPNLPMLQHVLFLNTFCFMQSTDKCVEPDCYNWNNTTPSLNFRIGNIFKSSIFRSNVGEDHWAQQALNSLPLNTSSYCRLFSLRIGPEAG